MKQKTRKQPKAYDNSWIGNMNAAHPCKLYKGTKIVGYCVDTPNAIAFGMKQTGADKAVSKFQTFTRSKTNIDGFESLNKKGFVELNINRIEAGGWMNSNSAGFVKA